MWLNGQDMTGLIVIELGSALDVVEVSGQRDAELDWLGLSSSRAVLALDASRCPLLPCCLALLDQSLLWWTSDVGSRHHHLVATKSALRLWVGVLVATEGSSSDNDPRSASYWPMCWVDALDGDERLTALEEVACLLLTSGCGIVWLAKAGACCNAFRQLVCWLCCFIVSCLILCCIIICEYWLAHHAKQGQKHEHGPPAWSFASGWPESPATTLDHPAILALENLS